MFSMDTITSTILEIVGDQKHIKIFFVGLKGKKAQVGSKRSCHNLMQGF